MSVGVTEVRMISMLATSTHVTENDCRKLVKQAVVGDWNM
jgi:hypothetical protein